MTNPIDILVVVIYLVTIVGGGCYAGIKGRRRAGASHFFLASKSLRWPTIGLALFATAIGLFTAIPLVFSHVLFKAWISRFEVKIKASSQKLITLVTNYKKDPKLLDKALDLDEDESPDATNRLGGRKRA